MGTCLVKTEGITYAEAKREETAGTFRDMPIVQNGLSTEGRAAGNEAGDVAHDAFREYCLCLTKRRKFILKC